MKKYFLFVLSFGVSLSIFAQSQIPNVQTACATATQGTVGNFTICYTIGEMPLVKTEQSNGLMITQGIMQPLTFAAYAEFECFSQTDVRVYPNPTPGLISLRLSLLKKGNVQTVLYDAAGKQILTSAFAYDGFVTKQYNIQKLLNGVYYLQLLFTEVGGAKPKKCMYTIQKIN